VIGFLFFSSDCRRVRCEERVICGGRFCCAFLPAKPRKGQIRKAARLLKKRQVLRAVFPEDCSHMALWQKQGIEAMDSIAFRVALLPRILSWALGGKTCVRAGIFAQRGDFRAQKAAELLVRRSRYLYLDCGQETEELAAMLRRDYGVAAIMRSIKEQLRCCDVLILFAPCEGAERCGKILSFFKESPAIWRYRFRDERNGRGENEQMMAALWEMGRLRAEDIQIF